MATFQDTYIFHLWDKKKERKKKERERRRERERKSREGGKRDKGSAGDWRNEKNNDEWRERKRGRKIEKNDGKKRRRRKKERKKEVCQNETCFLSVSDSVCTFFFFLPTTWEEERLLILSSSSSLSLSSISLPYFFLSLPLFPLLFLSSSISLFLLSTKVWKQFFWMENFFKEGSFLIQFLTFKKSWKTLLFDVLDFDTLEERFFSHSSILIHLRNDFSSILPFQVFGLENFEKVRDEEREREREKEREREIPPQDHHLLFVQPYCCIL